MIRSGTPARRGGRHGGATGSARRVLLALALAWVFLVLAVFARDRVLESATFRRLTSRGAGP